jgi:hypothetical protein
MLYRTWITMTFPTHVIFRYHLPLIMVATEYELQLNRDGTTIVPNKDGIRVASLNRGGFGIYSMNKTGSRR